MNATVWTILICCLFVISTMAAVVHREIEDVEEDERQKREANPSQEYRDESNKNTNYQKANEPSMLGGRSQSVASRRTSQFLADDNLSLYERIKRDAEPGDKDRQRSRDRSTRDRRRSRERESAADRHHRRHGDGHGKGGHTHRGHGH